MDMKKQLEVAAFMRDYDVCEFEAQLITRIDLVTSQVKLVARAYEFTQAGIENFENTGERTFSADGVAALVFAAGTPVGRIDDVVGAVINEMTSDREFCNTHYTPDLARALHELLQMTKVERMASHASRISAGLKNALAREAHAH